MANMNTSSLGFLPFLLVLLLAGVSVLVVLVVLSKRSLQYGAFEVDINLELNGDYVFDEDGSLASPGRLDLQLRSSRNRILKEEEETKKEIDTAYKEAIKKQSISDALRAFDHVTIPTIIHIVKDPDSSIINEAEGKEQEQIDVMNKAFLDNNMGFTFELIKIVTHVSSDFWNEPCPRCKGHEGFSPMAKATREGGGDTLNVWFNNGPPFGFAMMGSQFGYPEPDNGVVVKHTTVHGGSNPKKNLGTLLIHEVGHWLGLVSSLLFVGYHC